MVSEIITLEALQNEGKQIVYLAFNRDVAKKMPHVQRLAKSICEEGLHTPLHLIPATTALAEDIELLDSHGSRVEDGENKFALVDGNNRYKAIQVLRESNNPGRAADPIDCIIDEGAKDIRRMVMTMNNVVKPWSNADAIKAAYRTKPDDVINFIAGKVKEGFSFSTLSLLLTGQKDKITKDVVMKYTANSGTLPKCDLDNSIKKIDAMKEAGFSDKFIKNRYLVESINALVFQGYHLDEVLEALKSYTIDEIQFAEDGRDLSLLEKKVEKVVVKRG